VRNDTTLILILIVVVKIVSHPEFHSHANCRRFSSLKPWCAIRCEERCKLITHFAYVAATGIGFTWNLNKTLLEILQCSLFAAPFARRLGCSGLINPRESASGEGTLCLHIANDEQIYDPDKMNPAWTIKFCIKGPILSPFYDLLRPATLRFFRFQVDCAVLCIPRCSY